jgi:FolB domain-containing protein
MRDRIYIKDLHLRTVIGVHDWERRDRQDIVLSLSLETDLSRPASTDSIEDTLDYRALTKSVIDHVERSEYQLIERLAASVAEMALEQFPSLRAISVTVDKPGALRFARSVEVELRRERAD